MLRALFTSASGMIIQERRQANVANNLANTSTTAFKKQEMFAKELDKATVLAKDNDKGSTKPLGDLSFGAEIDEIYIDYEQGLLQDTNINTDFALEGQGFFKVRLADNTEGYTRDGNFKIDNKGYLTTAQGGLVLGTNLSTKREEPIKVDNKEINCSKDGILSLDDKNAYQLKVVNLNTVNNINALGNGIYKIQQGNETAAGDVSVYQGKLERSNVNPLEEMVKMIEITRGYESNQKVIQSIDNTLGKAVNDIGKIR